MDHELKMITLAILVISLLTKEIMFQYLSRLGKQIGTEEFIANARRRRSDIYSSFVVVIGILSMMLAHAFGFSVLSYVDSVAGLIIALFICKMGFS